jgi:hypothetical protein
MIRAAIIALTCGVHNSGDDIFDIVLHKLFGEHRYLVSRALCRAGGIPGLAFLKHCYPLAMSTRSADNNQNRPARIPQRKIMASPFPNTTYSCRDAPVGASEDLYGCNGFGLGDGTGIAAGQASGGKPAFLSR